jgi:hypothetical protein
LIHSWKNASSDAPAFRVSGPKQKQHPRRMQVLDQLPNAVCVVRGHEGLLRKHIDKLCVVLVRKIKAASFLDLQAVCCRFADTPATAPRHIREDLLVTLR